jgi:hypothetical protein
MTRRVKREDDKDSTSGVVMNKQGGTKLVLNQNA